MLAHSAASAAVPPAVVTSTIHVATSVAAGTAVGEISGPVAALTEQVLKTMFLKKLMTATTILMAMMTVAAITFGSLAIGQTEGALQPRDHQPLAEKPVDAPAKEQEKEPFTAWGKEVGGLRAGLGFPLGDKRAYRHGESVALVLRVRNVSKETVDFSYIWAFFIENPPTIMDPDGQRIQLPKYAGLGLQHPRDAKLAPGKEVDIFDWDLDLRPKGESGRKGVLTIHGTGMFSLQCERVVGPTSGNPNHPDPAREKLATGKLELEIKKAAANPEKEPFTAWGKEVGGLQAGLGFPLGGHRAYHIGETVEFVLRVRNVSKETVDFNHIWAFFVENAPTITDPDGKRIQLPRFSGGWTAIPPRHQTDARTIRRPLRLERSNLHPKGEEGRTNSRAIQGTGKFNLQCERVVGPTLSNPKHPDPARDKLATGKLGARKSSRRRRIARRNRSPPGGKGSRRPAGGARLPAWRAPGQYPTRRGGACDNVVRVRNDQQGGGEVRIPSAGKYFVETPPTVTDAKGKSVPQPERIRRQGCTSRSRAGSLEPGKEIDLTGSKPDWERTLYAMLRKEGYFHHPQIPWTISVQRVEGRNLVDAIFKHLDTTTGGFDIVRPQ